VCVRDCKYGSLCMSVLVCVCVRDIVCECVHVHVNVCVCVCARVCVCVCVRICVCVDAWESGWECLCVWWWVGGRMGGWMG